MSLPDLTLDGTIRHRTMKAGRGGALASLLLAAVVVLAGVWCLADMLSPQGLLPVAGATILFILMVAVAGRGLWLHYPHRRLGTCNLVTLFRAGLISVLMVPLLAPELLAPDNASASASAWAVVAVALLAFLLDGIDGWLARRSGLQSAFGARFDMEVDAVFAALLALIALAAGLAGWWVLGLGFMRYGFVAAGWLLPWMRGELPERFRRKVVCVIQIGTLIALLAPAVQPPLSGALAGAALAVLVWSFLLDVIWLWRRRGAPV
jgi:phosphatidylglycerophosphate synthase